VQYGKIETLRVFKTSVDAAGASESQAHLRQTAKKIAKQFFESNP
jgi:hypothetical protein